MMRAPRVASQRQRARPPPSHPHTRKSPSGINSSQGVALHHEVEGTMPEEDHRSRKLPPTLTQQRRVRYLLRGLIGRKDGMVRLTLNPVCAVRAAERFRPIGQRGEVTGPGTDSKSLCLSRSWWTWRPWRRSRTWRPWRRSRTWWSWWWPLQG